MLTSLDGQITATGQITAATCTHYGDSDAVVYSAKYVSDSGGSGVRIYGDGLLTNKLTCEEPYCLDAVSWQPAKITLDEDFTNQIVAQVAKKLSKQKDPLEKNPDVDEVEIPPMSGFVEI